MKVQKAADSESVRRCFPVIHELRPHLDLDSFMDQAARQAATNGYQIAFVEDDQSIVAVAGYRFAEYLAWGKVLYVDDLVTPSDRRSKGYGGVLLDWLIGQARASQCAELHLDSGVQRFAAHRFYLQKRMSITSHHFAIRLD